MRDQLTHLCMVSGFPLRKWTSNDSTLLTDIPSKHCLQRGDGVLLPSESHSILRFHWDPTSDLFLFSISKLLTFWLTKCTILFDTTRLFDSLDWLALIIRAKLLIQATWLQQLDWDTPIDPEEAASWQ